MSYFQEYSLKEYFHIYLKPEHKYIWLGEMLHVNMSWTQLVVKRFHNPGERKLFSRLSISWHGMPGRKLKNSTFLKHSDLPNTHHNSICWIQKSLVRAKVGIPLIIDSGRPAEWRRWEGVKASWGERADHDKGQTLTQGHEMPGSDQISREIQTPHSVPVTPARSWAPCLPGSLATLSSSGRASWSALPPRSQYRA